jgi:uncharacterized membrane protein (UPF0127 family)
MGVRALAPDEGMVFVFDEPHEGGFWMKDTLLPLSIAFWDQEGLIIDIFTMEPCEADPCPTYRPRGPYVAALEMGAGWFDGHGVSLGDRVHIEAPEHPVEPPA